MFLKIKPLTFVLPQHTYFLMAGLAPERPFDLSLHKLYYFGIEYFNST